MNLSIPLLETIDERCEKFEQHWIAKQPKSLESYLDHDLIAEAQTLLFAELLALEIDYRRRSGDTPRFEDYADRFPDRVDQIHDALQFTQNKEEAFSAPTKDEVQLLFPKLEIIGLLGVGGMGAVYQARQSGLDRLVAVKILPKELGRDVNFALRFTREARTLARLNHPNIVSVFEFGSSDETFYFLMEYVDGTTLRSLVSQSHSKPEQAHLKPAQALAIIQSICDALQYAHDCGVVHRDIKPENILIATDGTVKVADFGLSRIVGNQAEQRQLTRTHQVLGTPRYMSPEQFNGSRTVDHRSDIYSLGVVFYEMLTGELPIGKFEVPSAKVHVDVRLDEVVLRTLENEPRKRYQAASDVKSDVQTIATSSESLRDAAPALPKPDEVKTAPHFVNAQPFGGATTQATAAQFILWRSELMERVRLSLKPLRNGHIIQILLGVALVAIGAQCWATNTNVPYKLANGLAVHVYGILLIGTAAHVLTRVASIDYSQPVGQIRTALNAARRAYMRFGPMVGFPWWIMWIPLCVAIGFDAVLYPGCLWVSLGVGLPGWLISHWLYQRYVTAKFDADRPWDNAHVGRSLANASRLLTEIENAKID